MKPSRTQPLRTALVVAVVLGSAVLVGLRQAGPPTVVQSIAGRPGTPITALPYTISAPGTYYLVGNLRGQANEHGITISANDVTIDLEGFALVGVTGALDGIHVPVPQQNVQVSNGTIRGWVNGIGADDRLDNSRFERLRVSDNSEHGIACDDRCTIERCNASSNGLDGFKAGGGCLIRHCVAVDNGQDGIRAGESLVSECVSIQNGGLDFDLVDSTVANCHEDPRGG